MESRNKRGGGLEKMESRNKRGGGCLCNFFDFTPKLNRFSEYRKI